MVTIPHITHYVSVATLYCLLNIRKTKRAQTYIIKQSCPTNEAPHITATPNKNTSNINLQLSTASVCNDVSKPDEPPRAK